MKQNKNTTVGLIISFLLGIGSLVVVIYFWWASLNPLKGEEIGS